MGWTRRIGLAGLGMTMLGACSWSDASPGAPSAPASPPAQASPSPTPAPSPTQPATGHITFVSARPASGATLTVEPCPVDEYNPVCTRQLRLEFVVTVDRDVERSGLNAAFVDDSGRACAAIATTWPLSFTAGVPATVVADYVWVADPPEVPQMCALPATTTLLRVNLTQVVDGRYVTVARAEFPARYTFVSP